MAVCRLCMREVLSYLDWSECLLVSGGYSHEGNYWSKELGEVRPLSYKDCYYKYTHFKENVPDHITQFICEICASCVKDFHLLVEKSVETKRNLEHLPQSGINGYNEDDKVFQKKSQLDGKDNELYGAKNQSIAVDPLRIFETNEMDIALGTAGRFCRRKQETADLSTSSCSEDFKEINVKIELCDTEKIRVINTRRFSKRKCTVFAAKKQEPLRLLCTQYSTDITECDEIGVGDTITRENTNSKDLELECIQTKKTKDRPKLSCDKTSISDTTSAPLKGKKKKELKPSKPCVKSLFFLCSQCSLTFKTMNDLARHEKIHDINRERKEVCPKCGLKLFTKLSLKQHMETHEVNREKKFKCDFCEKAFFNRGACNVHMRIHLGKMLQCPLCPKQLFRQIDLDRHMTSHSQTPINRVKPKLKYYRVKCRECNKEVRSDSFKEHQAMHMNKPIMQCTLCNKDFFGRAKKFLISCICVGRNYLNHYWLSERAILAAKNKDVDDLNVIIQNQIVVKLHSFKSVERVTNDDEATNYPVAFLSSLDVPSLPPHNLQLKVGSVIIMLRSLNQPKLYNGTSLTVEKLMNTAIQATIIKDKFKGEEVSIPRIPMIPTYLPFEYKRI